MHFVAIIGMATSLFAAVIGLRQNDIKKVLAYSTVSQLGSFMFVALGMGACASAMFHVTTHAFFKALLFLAAGSVIHGMGGEQDIRKMGGLRKAMPITFWVFLIGTFAIPVSRSCRAFSPKTKFSRIRMPARGLWLVGCCELRAGDSHLHGSPAVCHFLR
jgi:NADH-quinone oxidoreductase subunit L